MNLGHNSRKLILGQFNLKKFLILVGIAACVAAMYANLPPKYPENRVFRFHQESQQLEWAWIEFKNSKRISRSASTNNEERLVDLLTGSHFNFHPERLIDENANGYPEYQSLLAEYRYTVGYTGIKVLDKNHQSFRVEEALKRFETNFARVTKIHYLDFLPAIILPILMWCLVPKKQKENGNALFAMLFVLIWMALALPIWWPNPLL